MMVKNTFSREIISGLLCGLSLMLFMSEAQAKTKELVIGNLGNQGGMYQQLARTICSSINQGTKDHDVSCKMRSLAGSGDINSEVAKSLGDKDINLAFTNSLDTSVDRTIKEVVSFNAYTFTVLARADAEINTFYSLRNKRVSIGNPGSSQRRIMEDLMAGYRWDAENFAAVAQLKQEQQAKALCENEIDAAVYNLAHPSPIIERAMASCDLNIVRVNGNPVGRLIEEKPSYSWMNIPSNIYGNEESVRSLGVRTSLMAEDQLDRDSVYVLTKAIFDNLASIKEVHPALEQLDEEDIVTYSLASPVYPVHQGAHRYYTELSISAGDGEKETGATHNDHGNPAPARSRRPSPPRH